MQSDCRESRRSGGFDENCCVHGDCTASFKKTYRHLQGLQCGFNHAREEDTELLGLCVWEVVVAGILHQAPGRRRSRSGNLPRPVLILQCRLQSLRSSGLPAASQLATSVSAKPAGKAFSCQRH